MLPIVVLIFFVLPMRPIQFIDSAGVYLRWEDPNGNNKYNIYQAEGKCSSESQWIKVIGDLTVKDYTLVGLKPATDYCFNVRAYSQYKPEGPMGKQVEIKTPLFIPRMEARIE